MKADPSGRPVASSKPRVDGIAAVLEDWRSRHVQVVRSRRVQDVANEIVTQVLQILVQDPTAESLSEAVVGLLSQGRSPSEALSDVAAESRPAPSTVADGTSDDLVAGKVAEAVRPLLADLGASIARALEIVSTMSATLAARDDGNLVDRAVKGAMAAIPAPTVSVTLDEETLARVVRLAVDASRPDLSVVEAGMRETVATLRLLHERERSHAGLDGRLDEVLRKLGDLEAVTAELVQATVAQRKPRRQGARDDSNLFSSARHDGPDVTRAPADDADTVTPVPPSPHDATDVLAETLSRLDRPDGHVEPRDEDGSTAYEPGYNPHPELAGVPRDERLSERVRRIATSTAAGEGRPVSTSEVLNAISRSGLDMSGYHRNFVSNTLAKALVRFGDDDWWPTSLAIPEVVPHTDVLLPRQVKALGAARLRIAALNATRRSSGAREIVVHTRDVPRA